MDRDRDRDRDRSSNQDRDRDRTRRRDQDYGDRDYGDRGRRSRSRRGDRDRNRERRSRSRRGGGRDRSRGRGGGDGDRSRGRGGGHGASPGAGARGDRRSKWDEDAGEDVPEWLADMASGAKGPKPPPGVDEQYFKTIKLQGRQFRALIGPGGETIRDIRARSGSDVQINHHQQDWEGTVNIIGNVEKALPMIKEALAYWGCPLGKPVKPPGGWGPGGPPKADPAEAEAEDPRLEAAAAAARAISEGLGRSAATATNTPSPGGWVGPGAAGSYTPEPKAGSGRGRWIGAGSILSGASSSPLPPAVQPQLSIAELLAAAAPAASHRLGHGFDVAPAPGVIERAAALAGALAPPAAPAGAHAWDRERGWEGGVHPLFAGMTAPATVQSILFKPR